MTGLGPRKESYMVGNKTGGVPRYTFQNDSDTGLYYSSADTIGFVVHGKEINLAEKHHETAMEMLETIRRRAGWDSLIFISLITAIGVTIWHLLS